MQLPIDEVLPQLCQQLQRRDEAVLQAPPGAGKTTHVPLALLQQAWLGTRRILMLEPRRLAARNAAERMAELLGEDVGQCVGYRVRLQSRLSRQTRIEVVTEGILTRLLQDDPALSDVGLLIFDEFHERSLDADLGLALALQGRELFSDLRDAPLKLLIMSATLESDAIATLLTDSEYGPAPVVSSQGRLYPVDIRYGAARQADVSIVERCLRSILQSLANDSGSLLVFLPGQGEIRAVQRRLEEQLAGRDDLVITPLYGDLDLQQQRRAIEAPPPGVRKITLATNIAETSLTIEGVQVVVDCGLARSSEFDPTTGMSRLQTRSISSAAATQRAGRAGRLQAGICYRLWSETQHQQLRPFTEPGILQADLASLALQLLRWGVSHPDELRWLDPPPAAHWNQAVDLLQRLRAIEPLPGEAQQWRLSKHGSAMGRLPVHPRLAHMLLTGKRMRQPRLAAELAALLSERDPAPAEGADIALRLHLLRGKRESQLAQQSALARLRQQVRQYLALLSVPEDNANTSTNTNTNADDDESMAGCLLACAYPDRIARRRGPDTWQLANGRGARFRELDSLMKYDWLAVAQLQGRHNQATDSIALAAHLDPMLFENELAGQLSLHKEVQWDSKEERFVAETQRRLGAIVVDRRPMKIVPAERRRACLLDLVRKRGLQLLPWTDATRQWQQRVLLLRHASTQGVLQESNDWPDVSDAQLLQGLEQWLAPWLDKVNRLSDFSQLNLPLLLQGLLPWPLPQLLEEQAPTHIRVPSGSRLRIDYSSTPPVLAVKLQEMFGCRDTPTIANGRITLVLHLLSPALRPIQVTQDLAGFWQGSYLQVRKDMRGRYPKHQWPDDPLQAMATARTTRPRPK